ncbi:Ig-like domain-containing protein [Sodalis sp. dw_96]|uniref:Ig-like domain-containing protein n=1 Tax=Sodalis sp. dw_96 TaxID=2719794 RepID=UPI001BD4F852|nr:Ig-like domain-containing protein [Sodalis sp. dw_96]
MSDDTLPSILQDACHDLTLTATTNAIADGCDTNSATARLCYQGRPLCGQLLSFTLSGDALFTDGTQQFSATTDGQGEATVFFTDTRPETVLITCNFNQTQSWESVSFDNSPLADIGISGAVLQNNAQADGMSRNGMRYRVYHSNGGAPVPGTALAISVSGGAMLIPPAGPWVTDANGIYDLYVTSGSPGQVLVSAQVPSAPEATNNTFLNFTPVAVYSLTSNTIRNYQSAGGGISNTIVFTLTRDSAAAANERMSFTANPPTATIQALSATNADGQLMVDIISPFAGEVEITAVVESQPSLQPVHVIVTFTEPVRLYFIANEVITDNAPAGGVIPNQVRFTVYTLDGFVPQPGIAMSFSVTGSARVLPSSGPTDLDGTIAVEIYNNVAQPVTLTARITSEPTTDSNVDLSFT